MEPDLLLSVQLTPEGPGQARRAVEVLAGRLREGPLRDLQLLVSELVTNSFLHASRDGDGRVEIEVCVLERQVRASVRDDDPGVGRGAGSGLDGEDAAWGLFLINQMADRWGVEREAGTVVWFELDLRPGESARRGAVVTASASAADGDAQATTTSPPGVIAYSASATSPM